MPLKPLGNALFGEIIEHDDHEEIREETREVLSTFSTENKRLARQAETAQRQLLASLDGGTPQQYQVEVIAVGPGCAEVRPGDVAILPPDGGTMITVVDEETMEYQRVFCITEDAVLAVFRED